MQWESTFLCYSLAIKILYSVLFQQVLYYVVRPFLCSTLTGSFSCVWYYWTPNSSFPSRNCLWHPLYRSSVLSIIPFGQKSMYGCQRFCFLFFASPVRCPTGLSAGTWAVCFVHYSTFRHHSKSFSQPSAFCRRHPTSKLSSTKWRVKQTSTDDIKVWMCNNQLKLNEDKTEAILFSTPSLSSCHCLPSSIMVGTHEIVFSD